MKNKRISVFLVILSVLSFLGMLLVYPKLPDVVPTHFGFDGKQMIMGRRVCCCCWDCFRWDSVFCSGCFRVLTPERKAMRNTAKPMQL